MLLLGLLLVTNTFRVSEAPPATRTVAGCPQIGRGNAGPPPSSAILRRTSADLVAIAVVEGNTGLAEIPEAATPDSQYITVAYRLEKAFRNTMDCRASVDVTNRVERGKAPSTDDAPLRGSRVLLYARPTVSANFRYITNAAPPLLLRQGSAVLEVTSDPEAPPTTLGAGTPGLSLVASVPAEGPGSFLSAGPSAEFPARLTLVNTTSTPVDVTTLGPTQWRVQVNDAEGRLWTHAITADLADFPSALLPGERSTVDLVSRPEGPEALGAGVFGLEARLETAGEPVASVRTTVIVRCVFDCATG